MRQIQAFDPLTFEKEQELAKRWRHKQDRAAFHQLMESYLRLVVKVAVSFRGYGLPLEEMIQEGNIGLMQAIARFEPERGFRLSTYAMWWIRASIQEYILNNWSLVKIGTNSVQKKLFFSLRKLRNQLQTAELEYLSDDTIETIAEELGVKEADVRRMEQRLSGVDNSLNNIIGGNEEDGNEWQDWLVEERPNQEEIYADKQQTYVRRHNLNEALDILDERERMIFISRRLNEPEQVPTLEDLSQKLGISRERVRQLEVRAFNKVQTHMQEATN
jgi:RNA polymerase sigma-32 factor